jgi:hypothetical protein
VVIVFSVMALGELKMKIDLPPAVNWLFVILAVLIYIYSNVIRGYAFSRGSTPKWMI